MTTKRGRIWWLGALQLTAACNMYDGALLFVRQQPVAAAPASLDAGTIEQQMADSDASGTLTAAADGGGQLQGTNALPDAEGLPPAAAGAGGAGVDLMAAGGAQAGQGGSRETAGAGGMAGSAGAAAGAGAGGGGGAAEVVDPRCLETGAKLWADNGHCYIPVELAQTWNVSRDHCLTLGGRLVSITSAQEQAFVATVGAGTARWIGLSKFGSTTFTWISGEQLAYTRWQAGAPSVSGEAAVAMLADSHDWVDSAVTTARASLCERE